MYVYKYIYVWVYMYLCIKMSCSFFRGVISKCEFSFWSRISNVSSKYGIYLINLKIYEELATPCKRLLSLMTSSLGPAPVLWKAYTLLQQHHIRKRKNWGGRKLKQVFFLLKIEVKWLLMSEFYYSESRDFSTLLISAFVQSHYEMCISPSELKKQFTLDLELQVTCDRYLLSKWFLSF